MALFKKTKQSRTPETEAPEVRTGAESAPQQATLTSGRMAGLFLRLYQWIFSVNLSMDAYQIESGAVTFGGETLAMRGRYSELLDRLAGRVLEEQQEAFLEQFSPEHLRHRLEEGLTWASMICCAEDLAETDAERSRDNLRWYEFRAEWMPETDGGNFLLILHVRPVRDDLDSGRELLYGDEEVEIPDSEEDWNAVRASRLLGVTQAMTFEYNVKEDRMYLHRKENGQADRITEHFLISLETRSDWLVFHESVREVRNLLRCEDAGVGARSTVILYRENGSFGAPFHHYKLVCAPLETAGKPTWMVGTLEDIEEQAFRESQSEGLMLQVSKLLEMFHVEIYEINAEKNQIFRILNNGEGGLHREEKPQKLSEYINRRIENGSIAEESRQNYLDMLKPRLLEYHTGTKNWEFESRMRDIGDTDFRWYSETIIPFKGKPGVYIRWRYDITEAHAEREQEYTLKEMTHLTEYNSTMLDTMASLVEFRNIESSNHIQHVRQLARILLEDIAERSPQYGLTRRQIGLYCQAASMHDIGKITIPDQILNKPGRYTPEEYEQMKVHTTNGARIVDRIEMPGQDELKDYVRDVVLHHHERYDGRGYPDGLQGEEISIGVQAISLSDVYDALVSERCYKESYTADESLRMILDGECGQFNPLLLESLKACEPKMRAIYEEEMERGEYSPSPVREELVTGAREETL